MKLDGESIQPKEGLTLLLVGVAGALVADYVGIPAGATVGALLSSGIYRLAGGEPGRWRGRYSRLGRLLLGAVIGSTFGLDVIAPLKAALLPMMVFITMIVGAGLGLGWMLSHYTRLDLPTALMSAVPGGLPAMVSMAEDLEADATVVALLHFFRLTTILLVVPLLVSLLGGTALDPTAPIFVLEPVGLWRTAVTLLWGFAGGWLVARWGVVSGELIGGIIAVSGANLLGWGMGPLHPVFRLAAMLFIGIGVGAQMARESLRRLQNIALPAMSVILIMIFIGLSLGWTLSQVTPLDLPTALLSSVPGGAATMPAVALDLGGDMRLVAALHLTRQIAVFVLLPLALSYLFRRRQHAADRCKTRI